VPLKAYVILIQDCLTLNTKVWQQPEARNNRHGKVWLQQEKDRKSAKMALRVEGMAKHDTG
jgi:hypothetical protein